MSEERISKLNLVIYRKLRKVKPLTNSLFSIQGFKEAPELRETIKIKTVIESVVEN